MTPAADACQLKAAGPNEAARRGCLNQLSTATSCARANGAEPAVDACQLRAGGGGPGFVVADAGLAVGDPDDPYDPAGGTGCLSRLSMPAAESWWRPGARCRRRRPRGWGIQRIQMIQPEGPDERISSVEGSIHMHDPTFLARQGGSRSRREIAAERSPEWITQPAQNGSRLSRR